MPDLQNESQKDENKANSQIAPSRQARIAPIAANILNTVGPVLSTVSTAAGYSWSVNVAETMIAANIGSAFTFAANTLNFWGARNDYSARRSEIAKEIKAMPKICDSGIDSVLFTTKDMPMDEEAYYFYKDEDIWIFIRKKDGESEPIRLTENGRLEQNSPASLQLLLPIIHEKLKSLSDDKPKLINGKLGIALAYLAESLIKADPNLAPVRTLSEEQKGWLAINTHSVVYISQALCLAACAAAAVAYGVAAAQPSTNTAETSDGASNEYIDPILPLGYISASIAFQSLGYCISTLGTNSQNQKKVQLEKEYSSMRADRDKLQVTSNQKQKIKELIAYFSWFMKQVQGVEQNFILFLENENEMSPDLFRKLILNELHIFLDVLDSIRNELKPVDIDKSASLKIGEFKDEIIDLSSKIEEDFVNCQKIGKRVVQILREALSSIGNHIAETFLQDELTHKNETENESAVDSEVSVHVQDEGSSHRLTFD